MSSRRVKRKSPGISPDFQGLRLRRLKLFSLERRRWQRHLMEPFNVINGFVSITPNEFFTFRMSRNMHGHPIIHASPRVLAYTLRQSFAVRVVSWNLLATHAVMVPSVDCFKTNLDKVWQFFYPDLVQKPLKQCFLFHFYCECTLPILFCCIFLFVGARIMSPLIQCLNFSLSLVHVRKMIPHQKSIPRVVC